MLMYLLHFINPFWEKKYQVRVLKSGDNNIYTLSQKLPVPLVRAWGIDKILSFLFIYILF